MMAGSIRSIIQGAVDVNREEFQAGKSIDDIKQELIESGTFSEHNIKRILKEIEGKPITDDIPADIIKDSYNVGNDHTLKVILREDLNFKQQDVIRYKNRDWVVQQIDKKFGDVEMLMKY